MAIRVSCPVCSYHIKAPDGSYGRRGVCPRCKLMIRLPTKEEVATRERKAAEVLPPTVTPGPADATVNTLPEPSKSDEPGEDSTTGLYLPTDP